MFFIPIVNIVFYVIVSLALASVFGKGTGFAVGIIFLPVVFLPIMAFDSSRYIAPGAPAAPAPPATKP